MAWLLYATIVFSFASWLTAHVALVQKLFRTSPRRALVAAVALPLAPIYGHAAGHDWLSGAWLVLFVTYAASLFAGFL